MHASIRRALQTALVTGGLVACGAAAAHADDDGILTGLGVEAPVNVSVDVSGLTAAVLGDATADPASAAPAPAADTPAAVADVTGGDARGIASGTTVTAPVHVPVSIDSIALGILGDATTGTPTQEVPAPTAPASAPTTTVDPGTTDGIASGTTITAPVHVPVSIGSIALGILGDATTGTAPASEVGTAPATEVGSGDADGLLAGTTVGAPVSVPVTTGDVALGLLGDARTSGSTSTTQGPAATGPATEPAFNRTRSGVLTPLRFALPVSVPVTTGDVALALGGDVIAAEAEPVSPEPGTAAPGGTTTPGSLAPGATTPGQTPGTPTPGATSGPATTDLGSAATSAGLGAVPVTAGFASEVLAAGELAAQVEAAAAAAVSSGTAPASLATTGSSAGPLALVAAALLSLGTMLRRLAV
jgi:hypothetical protein